MVHVRCRLVLSLAAWIAFFSMSVLDKHMSLEDSLSCLVGQLMAVVFGFAVCYYSIIHPLGEAPSHISNLEICLDQCNEA